MKTAIYVTLFCSASALLTQTDPVPAKLKKYMDKFVTQQEKDFRTQVFVNNEEKISNNNKSRKNWKESSNKFSFYSTEEMNKFLGLKLSLDTTTTTDPSIKIQSINYQGTTITDKLAALNTDMATLMTEWAAQINNFKVKFDSFLSQKTLEYSSYLDHSQFKVYLDSEAGEFFEEFKNLFSSFDQVLSKGDSNL